ncbi:MAG: ABC transporter permease [Puniceicoccales bacterium]|nr:ABC transporter permease [Puniceicoccales bacterium]
MGIVFFTHLASLAPVNEILNSSILRVRSDAQTVFVECVGTWDITQSPWNFQGQIPQNTKKIVLDAAEIRSVSSPFLLFFSRLKSWAAQRAIPLETKNLPESVEKIFHLSQITPTIHRQPPQKYGFFYGVGQRIIDYCSGVKHSARFFADTLAELMGIVVACPKNFVKNLLPFIQQTGVNALPIVALISALVGLILAFVSVVQLERFGASIYVADLVSLAMAREMGCLMTGVIMAGRTGAAFAASIGSMQANEELDALQTFGINRIHYLVLPRLIALALMMPLLCMFADLIGIAGGMVSALPFTKGGPLQYLIQTKKALAVTDVLIGLVKSAVFGVIVGGIGCYRGMCCGRNAAAVGEATTSAVVQGITWIIIADAIFAVLCTALGI